MKLEYQEILPRKIVNIHRHVDGPWFWGKYSAHPYIGCRSGCEFCYLRGSHYLGRKVPESFDTQIQVKTNAVELLRKELPRLDREIITCGDWQQPAEEHYRLSRGMLEVVRDLSFPLFIVERSPLLTRDLDLLVEINQRAWVGVVYSMSNVDPILKQAFEPRSPGIKRRLQAMEKLATAGILVGTSLMPVLPLIGDDDRRLEETILATREHGGSFVMAGGLTMDGVQAEYTLEAARRFDLTLEARWRKLYKWPAGGRPSYSPPRAFSARLGLKVRELCARHNLMDRMPRYVAPGPLSINKRIAEHLFLKVYDLELAQADDYRIWAYRKAAWTVDECQESLAGIYQAEGEAGLQKLPGIGQGLAGEIAIWLERQPADHAEVEDAFSN